MFKLKILINSIETRNLFKISFKTQPTTNNSKNLFNFTNKKIKLFFNNIENNLHQIISNKLFNYIEKILFCSIFSIVFQFTEDAFFSTLSFSLFICIKVKKDKNNILIT